MGTLAQEGFLLLFRLEKRSHIVFCCFVFFTLSFIDILSFLLFIPKGDRYHRHMRRNRLSSFFSFLFFFLSAQAKRRIGVLR